MNKNCYRHVFNKARGIIMVVSEIARSRGKSRGKSRTNGTGKGALTTLINIIFAIHLLLGGILFPLTSWAEIVTDTSAPGNQRATILTAPNGVPLVNIQTPSHAGVSRNTYQQFDVKQQGAILNNARTNQQTQLGGWIAANPSLVSGSARIILNEIHSTNPSYLKGYIEVAGQRAQVIVANPAGVTCVDCGFINANRGTLTTGIPIINAGNLEGYRVEGGVITISGVNGLDTRTSDYTDLIAQSIQVNAKIWANDLRVTAGTNQVNAKHTQITEITTTNNRPTYAIDVAQLGGMYAQKITLIGTQDGVGVRHAGEIGASTGNVIITSDGHIESSGYIWSNTANVELTAQGNVNNLGVIESANNTKITAQGTVSNEGEIDAKNNLEIITQGDLNNRGSLLAKADVSMTANGANSQINSTPNSVIAAGMQEDGTVGNNGNITLNASGELTLNGKNLSGNNQVINAKAINLSESQTSAKNITLTASQGDINLSSATIVVEQALNLATLQTLMTDGAHVSADTLLINAKALSNVQGTLKQTSQSDLAINLTAEINNTQGSITANQQLVLSASEIDNTQGVIGSLNANTQLTATTGPVDNTQGRIEANTELNINSQGLDNNSGVLLAAKQVINTGNKELTNQDGQIIAMGSQSTDTLTITSGALNNNQGLIQAQAAININTQGQTLTNTNSGTDKGIIGQNTVTLNTGDINNQLGYVGSVGHLISNSALIDNTQGGVLLSQSQMHLTGRALHNNGGQIQSSDALTIDVKTGQLNNTGGLIRSGGHLDITAGTVLNNTTNNLDKGLEATSLNVQAIQTVDNTDGAIRTDEQLTLTVGSHIDNTRGIVSSANHNLTLQDSHSNNKDLAITNTDGTLIAGQILKIDSHSLTGDGQLLSKHNIDIQLTNTYTHTGELYAQNNAKLHTTGNIDNQSSLIANQLLDLQAATIDTQTGSELKSAHLKLKATNSNTFNNRGLIDGNNIEIDTITLNNLAAGRIYGDHISISATTVNNDDEGGTAPVIAARNRLDIGAQTINNNDHALIFSGGDLAIGGALGANRHATGQATTLNNNSATIEALGDIHLSVGSINNINQAITTSIRDLAPESWTEYRLDSGDVHQAQDKITRYTADEVEIYNCQATCIEVKATGDKSDAFTEYQFTRSISETVVDSSDPAKILAGGNLVITAGTVDNDKSQIIAGGNLMGNINALNNHGASGSKITTDTGSAKSYWRKRKKGKDTTRTSETAYNPAPVVESISIAPAVYEANTAVSGIGTQVAAYTDDSTTPTITGVSNNNPNRVTNPPTIERIVRFSQNSEQNVDSSTAVVSGGINRQVPNNNLFIQQNDAPNGFIVETDPAFANYRHWLSSDHLLNALAVDPATTQKRLGDGFYEQKLLREQVAMLTGRRFLEGYNNDEWQYQQLMQAGALFAQTYELRLGVALSAEQMAQLTTDIVWLVEKTITLTNGETARALVPQLYVYVKEGDLSATGGLIAADDSLTLNMSNDLNNIGRIAGRRIADISAENIHNLGGRLRGDTLSVSATNDLNNIGGRIEAKERLTVSAGRDLRIESTTSTQQNAQAARTNINRVAGLYVSGTKGLLSASAGRDLILRAGLVQSAGSAVLAADNDIRIETLNTHTDNRVAWDAQNFSREYKSTEIGSNIQTTGDLQIHAGGDISARAAQVNSTQGVLQVSAARNVEITAGEKMQGLDAASRHTSKGFMSKRTLMTRDDIQKTSAQNSGFSARSVEIQTGQDITLIGSDILADEGVNLVAGRDINIKSSQQRSVNNNQRIEKKSGLMSGGSFGFTLGKRQQTDQIDKTQVTQRSATVGALSGNINITADNDATIKASDLLARDGDINIHADNVNIEANYDTLKQEEQHKFKQSGLTVALSGGIVDSVKTIEQSAERIQKTDNDKLKALHAWRIGRVAQDVSGQLNNLENIGDDFSDPLNANTNTNDPSKPQSSGVNLSISLGSSKSAQKRQIRQRTALGSSAIARGDISITARNDQNRQDSGDINAQGAFIQGNKVTLNAAADIHLKSAENSITDETKSKSSSTGVGVSVGSDGLRFFVEDSKSRGAINQSNDQYLETFIQARQTAELSAGKDATLEGAQVKAKHITANITGNLTITSQQDEETYQNRQKSRGIKVSAGYGGSGPVSADINASQLKADANYRAVQEQSGLFAGDDGYEVTVGKKTQLVGGAIVSDAKATNNNLSTDRLEVANLQNRASYKVDAKSISMSTSSTSSASDGKVGLGGGFAKDSGTSQNTTYSAIGEGTLAVRSDPNFIPDDTLKRNPQQAHQILGKIFGEDKIQEAQEHLEVTQLFAEEAYRAVGDLYQDQENAQAKAQAARKAYEQGTISKQILDAFEQSAEDAKGNLPDKAITHALVGGITALLGGGDFIQGAMAAGLNEGAAQQLKDQLPEDSLLKNMVASLIGGAVGGSQGAIIAGNADKFNRQLHPTEMEFLEDDERLKRYQKEVANAEGRNINLQEAEGELKLAALYLVSESWEQALNKQPSSTTRQFLQQETLGKTYLQTDGSSHDLLIASKAERQDDTINLEYYSQVRQSLKTVLPDATLADYLSWAGAPVAAIQGAVNELIETAKSTKQTVDIAKDPETYEKLQRFSEFAKHHPEAAKALLLEGASQLSDDLQRQLQRGINKYDLYHDQNRNYDLQVAGAEDALSVVNPVKKITGGSAIVLGIIKRLPEGKIKSVYKAKQIDKWSRTPRSIQDRLTLEAAKKGAGNPIKTIELKDSRYKGMEKWEYRTKSKNGKDSVIHYFKDPKTGKLMDFKFKKHSTGEIPK